MRIISFLNQIMFIWAILAVLIEGFIDSFMSAVLLFIIMAVLRSIMSLLLRTSLKAAFNKTSEDEKKRMAVSNLILGESEPPTSVALIGVIIGVTYFIVANATIIWFLINKGSFSNLLNLLTK